MLNRGLHMGTFFDMANGRSSVSKEQFIIYKLLLMDIVDIKVIEKAEKQFDKLDINGDGELSILDIEIPQTAKLTTRKKQTRLKKAVDNVISNPESDFAQEFAAEDGRMRGVSIFADVNHHISSREVTIGDDIL